MDRARLLAMAVKARALGRPDAARAVAEICERMAAGAG
jgi:UDP-N-acetylglucosamine:LPS N-acetylglucosamine transferase